MRATSTDQHQRTQAEPVLLVRTGAGRRLPNRHQDGTMITEQTAVRAVGVGGMGALLRCGMACLDLSLDNDFGALGNTAEGQGGCAQYPAKAGYAATW